MKLRERRGLSWHLLSLARVTHRQARLARTLLLLHQSRKRPLPVVLAWLVEDAAVDCNRYAVSLSPFVEPIRVGREEAETLFLYCL